MWIYPLPALAWEIEGCPGGFCVLSHPYAPPCGELVISQSSLEFRRKRKFEKVIHSITRDGFPVILVNETFLFSLSAHSLCLMLRDAD